MSMKSQFIVPVFVVCHADDPEEAIENVNHAIDSSELIMEDSIAAWTVIEADVEEMDGDIAEFLEDLEG